MASFRCLYIESDNPESAMTALQTFIATQMSDPQESEQDALSDLDAELSDEQREA